MGITMPEMGGLEATRRVKEQQGTCVVMVTAYGDHAYRHRAEECGARGYVVRPLTAETLVPILERICSEATADTNWQ